MSAIMSLAKPAPADTEKRTAIVRHGFDAIKAFISTCDYHAEYTLKDPTSTIYNGEEALEQAAAAVMFFDADTAALISRYLDCADTVDSLVFRTDAYETRALRNALATAMIRALVGPA